MEQFGSSKLVSVSEKIFVLAFAMQFGEIESNKEMQNFLECF